MKIDITEINNFYSLITIESTIIDSMLTDLYTIIDKYHELISYYLLSDVKLEQLIMKKNFLYKNGSSFNQFK